MDMKKRILIIEDEPSIIELLLMVLSREGYELDTCQTGRDAIAKMKEFHPHLILLDVMLPGLDGASIVKIMAEDETLMNIPVLVTSALTNSQQLFQKFPQVKGFCTKPFVLKELVVQIKKAIGDEF